MTFGRVATLAVLLGCGPGPEASPVEVEETTTSPLQLGMVGCDELTPSGRCTLDAERSLTLRVDAARDAPRDPLRIEIDGVSVIPATSSDIDGITLRLEVPVGAESLVVRHGASRSATFQIVEPSPDFITARASMVALVEADASWPQLEEYGDAIAATLDDPRDRHRFACEMAAAAFDLRQWSHVRHAALALASASGDVDLLCVGRAQVQAAHAAILYASNYADALEHIAASRRDAAHVEALVSADMLSGMLEQRLGHHDVAVRWFEDAERRATRVGLLGLAASIAVTHATSLAELGRFTEAESLARQAIEALPAGDPAVDDVKGNAAWVRVLHREVDESAPDPSEDLSTLLSAYEAAGDPLRAAGIRLDAAIAASQAGRFDEADRHLAALDRTQIAGMDQVWIEWTAAQVAQARHASPTARKHLGRALALAELHSQPVLAMRVHAARGRLEERSGDDDAAAAAYALAEIAEDDVARSIAPMAGRSSFTSSRWRDRAQQVELALRSGDSTAALCVVLGARARHLRGLRARASDRAPHSADVERRRAELLLDYRGRLEAISARADESWRLTLAELDELRAREASERARADALLREAIALTESSPPSWSCEGARGGADALLTMHPASVAGRWWLIVHHGGIVTARAVESTEPSPTAAISSAIETLVTNGPLAEVHSLTVVPVGALFDVDVHLVPGIIGRSDLQVSYSLGLGALLQRNTGSRRAAVVGNAANLRDVALETDEIRSRLRALGMQVDRAWQPTIGDPPPGLLHYAGHASRGQAAGWDSWIELDDRRITAAELVARGQAPAIVVLSACDAGASDASLGDGGMNMASSFLLAGSTLVIAPTREVDDALAREFSRELYAALESHDGSSEVRMTAALADVVRRDARFAPWRAWTP